MSDTSSIILTGEILPEHDFDNVVGTLAKVLKTTESVAAKLLTGRETIIKRNVPEVEVARYVQAIRRTGAAVRVERGAAVPAPMSPPVSGAPSAKPALALAEECVICPECRHHQPKRTLCQKCGCDMVRIRAAREAAEKEESAARVAPGVSSMQASEEVEQQADAPSPGVLGFWPHGRIGRLRLIAYLWPVLAISILTMLVTALLRVPGGAGGISTTTVTIGVSALVIGALVFVRLSILRGNGVSWKWLPLVVLLLLLATFSPALARAGGVSAMKVMLVLAALPICLFLFVRALALRMHDIGFSGKWLPLLLVLPVVGALLDKPGLLLFGSALFWAGVVLLIALPGAREENSYGPPCMPNTMPVKIGVILVVALLAIGLDSYRTGIRAYQDHIAGKNRGAAGDAGKTLDFSDPVYAEVRLLLREFGREIEVVYLGKMANEADCTAQSEIIASGFVEGCDTCSVKARQCRRQLSPKEALMFEDAPIHTTYLSIARGAADEREGRMVVWGMTAAEAYRFCEDMKKTVGNAQKGFAACIPAQPS